MSPLSSPQDNLDAAVMSIYPDLKKRVEEELERVKKEREEEEAEEAAAIAAAAKATANREAKRGAQHQHEEAEEEKPVVAEDRVKAEADAAELHAPSSKRARTEAHKES